MDLLVQLAYAVVILGAGLAPYWVAGRRAIPARERLPWHELDLVTVLRTLLRGATVIGSVGFGDHPGSRDDRGRPG